MSGFKEHPDQTKVAEDPDGIPSPLSVDSEGALVVSFSEGSAFPEDSTGAVETSSPTVYAILSELLREVRKGNMYLALLTGEEITDSDIEE